MNLREVQPISLGFILSVLAAGIVVIWALFFGLDPKLAGVLLLLCAARWV
jgi:hypothetical protein